MLRVRDRRASSTSLLMSKGGGNGKEQGKGKKQSKGAGVGSKDGFLRRMVRRAVITKREVRPCVMIRKEKREEKTLSLFSFLFHDPYLNQIKVSAARILCCM